MKKPTSLVVVSRVAPVSVLRATTATPGRMPPPASFTVPCKVPVTVCATAGAGHRLITSADNRREVRHLIRG